MYCEGAKVPRTNQPANTQHNGPMAKHNYAAKTVDELDELADYYFRLHGEARQAYDANGRQNGGYWDKAMQEYMSELRAIDRAKQAKTAESGESGEVAL